MGQDLAEAKDVIARMLGWMTSCRHPCRDCSAADMRDDVHEIGCDFADVADRARFFLGRERRHLTRKPDQ